MIDHTTYSNTTGGTFLKGTLTRNVTTYFLGPITKIVLFKDFLKFISSEKL